MTHFLPTARLVISLFRAFEQELIRQLSTRGITDVTPSHLNILRHLNNGGMQISQLAKDAVLSKQLVGRIVKELEQKGYLQLSPDPADGRVKFVRYTTKGTSLIATAVEIVTDTEQRYEKLLGSVEYKLFRKQLSRLTTLHTAQGNQNEP